MSDTLFAMPNAWSGVARTLDLGGVFDDYNISATPAEADAAALYQDWLAVGNALRSVALKSKQEVEKQGSLAL